MKQERKEALNKIFKYIALILNICIIKNAGDVEQTIAKFNNEQLKIKNMIDKRIEELNLSKYEKEEIDKYYSSKIIELMNNYLLN